MSLLAWISEHGNPVDLVMFIMGIGVFMLLLEARREIKDLKYKYNTLNVLVFYLSKHHQSETGTKLIKTSANSQGDYGIDRDEK
jgi:hypothetical protein